MRNLDTAELTVISGGNDTINSRVGDACDGQPDSTTVTVTSTTGGNLGVPGFGGTTSGTTTTVTTNCGDFRDQPDEEEEPAVDDTSAT